MFVPTSPCRQRVCPSTLSSLIPSLHTQQWGAVSAPSRCFGAAQLCCECLSPSTPSLRDLHPFGRDRNPGVGIPLSDPRTDTPSRRRGVCGVSCWSHAGDKAPFVSPWAGMPAAGMLPVAGPGGGKAGSSSSSPSDAFGTLRKVGHCVLFRFQETGPGGMKSRQLARLHPARRRENPFPAMEEALLWHGQLQRTPADPIRKLWRWHCLLCTPLALPREQKNSLPAFPTRGSS